MVRRELEAVSWIFYGITVLLLVIVISMLVWKLTGHSPTEITIMLWAMGIISTLIVLILTTLLRLERKVGELAEFKRQTIHKIKELEKRE